MAIKTEKQLENIGDHDVSEISVATKHIELNTSSNCLTHGEGTQRCIFIPSKLQPQGDDFFLDQVLHSHFNQDPLY
jgi:hypothetical protein